MTNSRWSTNSLPVFSGKTPKEWYEWCSRVFSVKIPWENLSKDTQESWIVEFDKRFIYVKYEDFI